VYKFLTSLFWAAYFLCTQIIPNWVISLLAYCLWSPSSLQQTDGLWMASIVHWWLSLCQEKATTINRPAILQGNIECRMKVYWTRQSICGKIVSLVLCVGYVNPVAYCQVVYARWSCNNNTRMKAGVCRNSMCIILYTRKVLVHFVAQGRKICCVPCFQMHSIVCKVFAFCTYGN